LENNLQINKGITKELKEQLTASQQMNADIEKAEERQRLDPGGAIKSKFDEAMGEDNFITARKQARLLAGREEDIELQDMFDIATGDKPSKINTSVRDMAKKLNIDTKGMDRNETEQAVRRKLERNPMVKPQAARDALEKNPEVNPPGGNGEPGAPGGPKNGDVPGGKLEGIVETIRDLVAKIEPKLPQMALGA
jgi:hypothetical protein